MNKRINLTVLESLYSDSKVPVSPFNNKTFNFKTINVSIKEALRTMSEHFVMSNSFNTDNILKRNKTSLIPFLTKRTNFVVIDLDDVSGYNSSQKIFEYFRENNLNCVLGKSRSHNAKDIFDMKGIVLVDFPNNQEIVKNYLKLLQQDLKGLCKVDLSSSQIQSFQAPSYKSEILFESSGDNIPFKVELVEETSTKNIEIAPDQLLLKVCLGIYMEKGFSAVKQSNESISFSHPVEKKSKGGYIVYLARPMFMKHWNESRSFNIVKEVRSTKHGKEIFKQININKQTNMLIDSTRTSKNTLKVNERYLKIDHDKSILIDRFINENINLSVKSPMGTAKSTVVEECIKKIDKTGKNVIIITNRISVANDFSKKYNIPTYQDEDIGDRHLIVQFDSLHKFNLSKFEYVILDEYMSLLLHSINELNASNTNLVKFYSALKKKCIVADAFMNDEARKLVGKTINIKNEYRDDVKLFEYSDVKKFVDVIIEKSLTKNKSETISASFMSINVLRTVEYALREQGLKVVTLTSETPQITKRKIYEIFDLDNHEYYDVVLYSPTLTVGVSNNNNVIHHFHYDSSMGADVISSLQMIKRSRSVEEIHLFVKERVNHDSTDLDSLNEMSLDNIKKYGDGASFIYDYDDNGEFVLKDLGVFQNKIIRFRNILENNHKNAFNVLLKEQFKLKPKMIETKGSIDLSKMKKEMLQEEQDSILEVLDNFDMRYQTSIEEIEGSTRELTPDEKMIKLVESIRYEFNCSDDELKDIIKKDIKTKYTYISSLKKLKMMFDYSLEDVLSKLNDIVANKTHDSVLKFYEDLLIIKEQNIKLQNVFSKNDIINVTKQTGINFKVILKLIGYDYKDQRYKLSKSTLNDVNKLKN